MFTIRFRGAVGLASARCSAALRALRKGPRVYFQFGCASPAGVESPVFVGPDKNSLQIKIEIQTRLLARTLAGCYPNTDFFPDKKRGVVTSDWVDLCKVEPKPGEDPTTFAWSLPAVRRLQVDTKMVQEKFREGLPVKAPTVWTQLS